MWKYIIIVLQVFTTNAVIAQIPVDSIKNIIQKEVAGRRSKSIIVGIITPNGRQILSEGKLSDANPVPPDSNTIYEICSITKLFTSLLLADMSLKRKLDLNAPISKFLPADVKAPIKNGKEISLLSLSTHRAGFPRNAYNLDPQNPDNPFADYTTRNLYEYISDFRPSYDVDSIWQYSNIGYTLLGQLISTIEQKSLETLFNETICRPLNMNRSVISLRPKLKSNIALGYSESGKPASAWDFLLAGGGGLHSTVNDLLNFAAANLGLTKTELLPAMELTHIPRANKDGNDNSFITMGWTLWNDNGNLFLWKDGGSGGYRTFLGMDKKNKVGVVVLSNSNNSVTDIGLHILGTSREIRPYKYPWLLLDTLRKTFHKTGVASSIILYRELKATKNPAFIFDELQLNNLGNELRRDKKIEEAIKIFQLNVEEYPGSTLVYESLGELYKRNRNKKLAISYFEKLEIMEPANPRWSYLVKKLKS
jgi:serine-type D-Ala-D-Ala carboxypeptidase/endopeptidase